MLHRWIDESPHEGPYVALGTIDSVDVQDNDNMEEDQEIGGTDGDH